MNSTGITLTDLKTAMDIIEAVCPRKSIASYMKMTEVTRNDLLKRIRPYIMDVDNPEISTEQITALNFNGVQILIDDSMEHGQVRTYNADDELIAFLKI